MSKYSAGLSEPVFSLTIWLKYEPGCIQYGILSGAFREKADKILSRLVIDGIKTSFLNDYLRMNHTTLLFVDQ
jgi:hypothetical protein